MKEAIIHLKCETHMSNTEIAEAIGRTRQWVARVWRTAVREAEQAAIDPEYAIHHPADCLGDTGAASGIILTGLAAMGLQHGYRRSPCLVVCSSDFGERALVAALSP